MFVKNLFRLPSRKNQVEEDGEDEDDGDAVFGEDGLDDLGEDGEHA